VFPFSSHSISFLPRAPRVPRGLNTIAVYLAVLALTLTLATWRMQAQEQQPAQPAQGNAAPQPSPSIKPNFSLSTNRTYGTAEKTRIYINYQAVSYLDFRVYQVKDPVKFFKQLDNPHQMGVDDRTEVASAYRAKPSFLEKLREFKSGVFSLVKSYVRSQLRRESRTAFNDKFRAGEQVPLNVADFARVPLLNPDQLVNKFRQMLSPLENQYDTRMVNLGQMKPGVYLIEAVNDQLRAYTIAVVTDLATINKVTSDGELLVYAIDRKSGEPRADVRIEVVRNGQTLAQGVTDKNGILKTKKEEPKPVATPTPTPRPNGEPEPVEEEPANETDGEYLVMATRNNEFAISGLESYYFEHEFGGGAGKVASYIYTDRPVYRPEQKVFFKGILRKPGENGYELLRDRTVRVSIEDTDGGKLFEKELPLSGRGTFSGEVELPGSAKLGYYRIVAAVGEAEATGNFDVAEYKKPEFKVKVSTPKPFVGVGEKTKFTVDARYFFGAPVANGDVKWYVYRSRYYHWWWADEDGDDLGGAGETEESEDGDYYGYGNDMVKEGEARLNADGKLEIEFEVPRADAKDPHDYTYRLEAMVTDSSRREEQGKASFTGTRGNVVATAQPERYVYYQGDTAKLKIRAADYEGKPVSAKVALKFYEQRYERIEKNEDGYRHYEYKLHKTELGGGEVTTNAQGEAVYDYRVPVVGYLRIETIVNEGGKQIISEGGYLYATDRNNKWADYAYRDWDAIKLVPDKKSYKPGEVAHVLAMLPSDQTHLLVTTEVNQVLSAHRIDVAGRAAMIDVPIEARYAPNVYLSVAFVKNGELFTSDKLLSVPAKDRFLNLEILPDKKEYKPRDPALYTIVARNADGSPAPGVEVSLGVVDEAIYSVQPDTSGDIRRAFYGRRYNSVQTTFSTAFHFTGFSGDKPMQLAMNKPSYQLADFKNDQQLVEPTIRKDFKDTAFWQPDVVTDGEGKATVKLDKLPDNLTTWRATARAVTADLRVGSRINKVLARKNLILRLETPRFLTEGDTVTISGIVHNYLNSDKATEIELQINGAKLLDAAKQTLTIPQNGEKRIDWRIQAPQVGNISLLATAKTNEESDGVELPLPIVPGGLHQQKSGVTTMTEDAGEKVIALDLPGNANSLARTLRVEASPSIAASLFGALDYLTGFPYGCTEQTMSSFLPNVVVAQALKEVKTTSIRDTAALQKKVQKGLDRLYSYQHDDGGWGWWKDDPTDPFMTAYVVDGLQMARAAGFAVDSYRLDRGRDKIRSLLEANKNEEGKPIDIEDRAYLIYSLNASAEEDPRFVLDLYNKRGSLQPYGRALLALALRARGDKGRAEQVAGEIERSARANEVDAHWESTRRPMLDFTEENNTEATALSLKALAQITPNSPVLAKAARWLVSNRRHGYYWESTKHTAFAIFGLIDYLRVSKELSPDYTVEVYLNGEAVGTKRFTAADVGTGQNLVFERKGIALGSANQIRVVKQGRGMLYVSSALDYYTNDQNVAPQSAGGLRLTREYLRLRVNDNKWVVEPLTGELRSGDLIVSRLRVQGNKARYLMIEDPIPAGCEQIERVSGIDLNYSDGKWSSWYSSREFRDQRTALFVNYFDGEDVFQYAMRVITPGDFRAAPARAELMYAPAIHANTANWQVKLLDKQ
jgi:alpha-2-macroglobulin